MNHIILFSELTSGRLQTILSGELHYKDVLSLVKEVNTKVVYNNVPATQAYIKTEAFNFQALGYKTPDDFKFTFTTGTNPEYVNITVTPVCHYELHDNFKITRAPDKHSKIIVGLLADEFERIKQRALNFLNSAADEKELRLYASKNRQFVKTCFHNHKALFHDLFTLKPDYIHHPNTYIHFYLNFFLIKLRLFYEKLFEDYLSMAKKTERQLLAELFEINPVLLNKQYEDSSEETVVKEVREASAPFLQSFATSDGLYSAYEAIGKEHNLSSANVKQILSLAGRIKWNGNKNILGDAIYQFMNKKDKQGIPMLEATPDVMASLISLLCIDSTGNSLSKATMKTLLHPSKSDKRPKAGAKDKFNIS